jgi:galactonate dehydratase
MRDLYASTSEPPTPLVADAGRNITLTKIRDVKTIVVNAGMRNWVFVKVETDDPMVYGWARPPRNGKPGLLLPQ